MRGLLAVPYSEAARGSSPERKKNHPLGSAQHHLPCDDEDDDGDGDDDDGVHDVSLPIFHKAQDPLSSAQHHRSPRRMMMTPKL